MLFFLIQKNISSKFSSTNFRLLILYCFCLFNVGNLVSQTKTVNITTAGTLSNLITATETTTITNLTVTGNIDARDVAFMRDKILLLSVLDLSAATINAYTGIDGTYSLATIAYPANELPLCAFYNASTITYKFSLTSIKLPTTLTSIGGSAFYYCYGLSGTFNIPASVTSIGNYALYGCSSLSAYTVETTNTRYSSNNGVLFNKLQDSLFICPSAKTGSYVIPSTVVSIGASAFDYCSGLTGNLIIPASVKSIGSYAFYYCAGFTGDLTIPSSMTSIAEGTFYGCGGLTGTVTIPQTITTIGAHSFFQCNKLSSFQVDALNTKYSSLDNVLFTKMQDSLLICPATKTGSYVIPSSVKGIGNYAFYNCSSISGSLVIPKSVGLIGSYAFYGCTLLSGYEVDALNTRYLSNNGVLFNKNQDSLLVCPSGKIGSYSIPNTVKDIGTYAFYYCTGLTGSINIPASVLSIGNYAFYGCTQLTALQAHVSNKIFSSLDGVLFNKNQDSLFICPLGKVGKYTIPSTVTAIDFSAFDGCVGLTAVEIPASVTSIGSYAFEYCSGLSEISLPTKITTIGSGAFYACTNLQKISIQNPIPPTIEYYTFDLVNKALCQLLVPVGSLIDYQISNYWKEFSLISESSFAAVPTVSSNNILRIYKKDQFLMVDGTKYGELVEVFLLNGKQVYTLISTGNNLSISLPKSNMYLIKTNKKATKVLL